MGSTSGATVANVSNIDVFEVGANIVIIFIKLRSRTLTLDKRVALEYFCRLKHEILFSGRAASEHVRKSLLLYMQLVWNETGSDLLVSEDKL